jgi:hypothetical protein
LRQRDTQEKSYRAQIVKDNARSAAMSNFFIPLREIWNEVRELAHELAGFEQLPYRCGMRATRTVLGVVVWLTLGALAWRWAEVRLAAVEMQPGKRHVGLLKNPVVSELWRYVASPSRNVRLEMDRPVYLGVGDPIFVIDNTGAPARVGEVSRVVDSSGRADERRTHAAAGEALFYPHAPRIASDARLEYYTTPQSIDWIVKTLLPPQKREQIAHEISAAFAEHHEEILAALRPVVEDGFREAVAVIEQDLPQVVERHRPELEKLGEKYRGEVVQKRLTPLVKKEIWPIVQRRAEPLAEEIGEEVWQRASVWRFGWRYAYDVSPFPQQNLVEKEWKRFVRDEVQPALESRIDAIVRVQQQILADVARNERVRQVVRESLTDIAADPEVQHVAWSIVQEAIIDNPRLHETLQRRWRSEEARQAMNIAAERLEPTVRRIGDMIFGTRENGVSPDFARVLRTQILGKDRRWLVLIMADGSTAVEPSFRSESIPLLRVHIGEGEPVNPFLYEAVRSSGLTIRD